jgi:ribosomal protein S27AE
MTATVIGIDDKAKKRRTCDNCASIIQYTMADTTSQIERDYTGDGEMVHRLRCPNCGKSIVVSSR